MFHERQKPEERSRETTLEEELREAERELAIVAAVEQVETAKRELVDSTARLSSLEDSRDGAEARDAEEPAEALSSGRPDPGPRHLEELKRVLGAARRGDSHNASGVASTSSGRLRRPALVD